MAKFTSTANLNLKWNGNEISGAAGATHRIPDALYNEFAAEFQSSIPGLTWVTQDETSSIVALPIAQTDVTGLTAALAAKAPLASPTFTGTVSAAAISTPLMTADAARFKGSPWYDVKAYGAVGDNATNDTTAIQNAINAAPAGAVVYFPAGSYLISSAVTASVPHVYAGDTGFSGGTVVRQGTINTTAFSLPLGADGSIFRGMKIIGPGAATSGRGIYSLKSIDLDDVRIQGFFDGLYLDNGAFYSRIIRSTFMSNANAGIRVADSYNTTIIGCRLQNNLYGLYAQPFTQLRVISSSIEQNTSRGLHLDGTSSTPYIDGCYFESAVGTADIYLAPTATVVNPVIINALFIANSVASYWHIDGYSVQNMLVISSDIRSSGSGGGSIRVSSSGSGVQLINNKTDGTVSISASGQVLQTSGYNEIVQSASTTIAYGSRVVADANPRWRASVAGRQEWGDGSATPDVNIYRSGVDVLATDDAIYTTKGIRTFIKAGIPVDGDFPTALIADGIICLDTTNNRIYARFGGTWRYATTT